MGPVTMALPACSGLDGRVIMLTSLRMPKSPGK